MIRALQGRVMSVLGSQLGPDFGSIGATFTKPCVMMFGPRAPLLQRGVARNPVSSHSITPDIWTSWHRRQPNMLHELVSFRMKSRGFSSHLEEMKKSLGNRRPRGSTKGGEFLQPGDSKHVDWWEQKMKKCQKPSTRELIKRLVSSNLLGLDGTLKNGNLKEGGLPALLLGIKRRFPHEVILTRVGEFYEACGFDACVLVEYAGLNAMGGVINPTTVPRAGCPIDNLRQTLDALTGNGFSVCIVEEVKGPSNSKSRKERFVSGHAHPGNPYVYGLAAADFDVEFPEPVSIIGIARSASGYCLISVVELMRSFSVEDKLTEEAVVAKLRAKPFQRLFLHKSVKDQSTETVRWGEFGEGGLLWAECRDQDLEWYDSDPVTELLSLVREIFDLERVTEFRKIVPPPGERPRPLNVGTASQVGILPTHGVPSLLRVLVPPNTNSLCVAYLRDLLLNPPPYRIAADIRTALQHMTEINRPIPDFECVSAAKLVKLIGAKEANHLEFARIKNMAEDLLQMEKDPQLNGLLEFLLSPTWMATGVRFERDQLVNDCKSIVQRLDEVLAPAGDPCNEISRREFVPDDFFLEMEVHWRARVRRDNVEVAYSEVDRAASILSEAIEKDFYPIVVRTKGLAAPIGGKTGCTVGEICYNLSTRSVLFKGKRFRPTVCSGGPGEEEIKRLKDAKDQKGKKLGEQWFTTERVDNAVELYKVAVERASVAVVDVLKLVAGELQFKLNTIVFIATFSIIAKAFFAHACEATRRRWVISSTFGETDESEDRTEGLVTDGGRQALPLSLEDIFPYWLDKTQDRIVLNSVQLESMILLTGPNGGGKSSILRSICAASLLGTCGLLVPAQSAVLPRFDSIMLRMMTSDSPADSKSSFQMEMSELRTILVEATKSSLVLVDELCKGTEVSKGTFIVASVLEHLDSISCLGVISTHLHGLLDMNLHTKRVVRKAMGVQVLGNQRRPTWKLVDGQCRESLAFETARKEGVPESVVQRAEEFFQNWNGAILNCQSRSNEVGPAYVDEKIDPTGLGESGVVESLESREPQDISPKYFVQSKTEFQIAKGTDGVPQTPGAGSLQVSRVNWLLSHSQYVSVSPNGLSRPLAVDVFPSSEISLSARSPGGDSNDLQIIFLTICGKKLSELYETHSSQQAGLGFSECREIRPRQKPPPSSTNNSCVYILKRHDGKLYVGETDDMSGRMERHRHAPGLHEASFLYVTLPNKSVARELETVLIKQLPSYGFQVVNRGDQNHRHFGTSPLAHAGGSESPPF